MKIILACLNSKFVHSSLSIRYIKAFAQYDDIKLFDATINENPMDIAIKIIEEKPEVVGFSCYIWNMENTIKVCSIIKEVSPGTRIILGGPEVSFDGSEVLERYACIDFVIQGEGEIPFKMLMDKLSRKETDYAAVSGLVFRDADGKIINIQLQLIENLDIIPFPYKDGIPDKILYYEASRGCPFGCKYCLSSAVKGVRYFSLDRVKRDLMYLIEEGVSLVKFVDRTFNANKKFAMDIWAFLIKNHGNTKFHFEIAADLLDDEAIELLKNTPKGLFQFEIGVQTTNLEVLKNINRVMSFERVKTNIQRIMECGNIHCHMDLIAGLPGEDIESFKNSFNMCMDIGPDVLQLGFLKVLKGTPIYYEREEFGIRHINFPPYHVLCTKDMSFEEINGLLKYEKIFDLYYNSGIFKLAMKYCLSQITDKFSFFSEMTGFFEEKGFFLRNLDFKDRFKFLYEFLILKYNNSLVKDILIHDYIKNTKKSVLPDFLKKDYDTEIKERIIDKREMVEKNIGESDFKKIFYVPVDFQIGVDNNDISIENKSAVAVFNLMTGEYCYI